jgi:hypothetical protein
MIRSVYFPMSASKKERTKSRTKRVCMLTVCVFCNAMAEGPAGCKSGASLVFFFQSAKKPIQQERSAGGML